MSTKIVPCNCVSLKQIRVKGKARQLNGGQFVTNIPFNTKTSGAEYQDKKYGVGMRLHNLRSKDGKACGATCTVCGEMKAA